MQSNHDIAEKNLYKKEISMITHGNLINEVKSMEAYADRIVVLLDDTRVVENVLSA